METDNYDPQSPSQVIETLTLGERHKQRQELLKLQNSSSAPHIRMHMDEVSGAVGKTFDLNKQTHLYVNQNHIHDYIINRLHSNPEWLTPFTGASVPKLVCDWIATIIISRTIRRSFYVYEAGLAYTIGVGGWTAMWNKAFRHVCIEAPLQKGELRCFDICPVVRGLVIDTIINFAMPYATWQCIAMVQAERFKSAEMPSGSRLRFTKSQWSTVGGIFKHGFRRGGGLRGALAMTVLPGLAISIYQGQAMKNFWQTIPKDEFHEVVEKQRKYLQRKSDSAVTSFVRK